jgi:hypothetical protein
MTFSFDSPSAVVPTDLQTVFAFLTCQFSDIESGVHLFKFYK